MIYFISRYNERLKIHEFTSDDAVATLCSLSDDYKPLVVFKWCEGKDAVLLWRNKDKPISFFAHMFMGQFVTSVAFESAEDADRWLVERCEWGDLHTRQPNEPPVSRPRLYETSVSMVQGELKTGDWFI